jgi:pimeloyl-ACP methyl ester carboxylesterase
MPLISVAGHRLEYAWIEPQTEAMPTLVFLHEGLGSVSLWRDFPAALCRRTGCAGLVYDRQGHGGSGPLLGPRSVRFMHDEALVVLPAVLETFRIRRPILVGHSDGGSIALIYEGSRIGETAGLILEAPHVFVEDLTIESIGSIQKQYETGGLRAKLARHHGEKVDPLFRSWSDVWLSADFRGWNIEEYLTGVRPPTLLIQGLDDVYGTKKQVDTIATALGDRCETIMLAQCGHFPHIDQRAAVEAAMSEFVSRFRGKDRSNH